MTQEITRMAVVGAGTMGAQIASLAAFSGRQVYLYDAVPEAASRGRVRAIAEILPRIEEAGLMPGAAVDGAGRLHVADSLEHAIGDMPLVIEAVREEIGIKRTLFAEMSAINPEAILATNSSSLSSSLLIDSVSDPSKLLNMHFFTLVWVRSMLEIMGCGQTSPETISTAWHFGRSLGLVTAVVRKESKGFIQNRIWRAIKRESLRVIDEGIATPEEVDRLFMIFFQAELAPFQTMDSVGLDVIADIETSYQNVTLDPTDLPSPTLHQLVREGNLGEKTGKGFYDHPNPPYTDQDFLKASFGYLPDFEEGEQE